jgi:hypothetical protein
MNPIEYINNSEKEENTNLENLIKDKRVIIVGPSSYLNDKKFGELVDSYDLVVRVNQGLYMSSKYPENYGKRTDLLYLCQRARDSYLNLNPSSLPKEFEDVKNIAVIIQKKFDFYPPIKLFCFKCEDEIKQNEAYCLSKGSFRDSETENPKIGHFNCIYSKDALSNLFKGSSVFERDLSLPQYKFNVSLLSGLFAILDILQFKPSELFILGYDFYQTVKDLLVNIHNNKSNEDVADNKLYCKGYRVIKKSMDLSHKDEFGEQFRIFSEIYKNKEKLKTKLTIDENLERIFQESLKPELLFIPRYKDNYLEFLKDKKVVLVGPSSYLQGKQLGGLIDAYDVVVRCNLGNSLSQYNSIDFGTRTDVIYLNQNLRGRLANELSEKFQDVKFIGVQSYCKKKESCQICKYCKNLINIGDEYYTETGYEEDDIYHFNCYKRIDYRLINEKVLQIESSNLRDLIEESPLIGLIAIDDLLKYPIDKLYITGFDFYQAIKDITQNGTKSGGVPFKQLYSNGYHILGGISQEHKDVNSKQLNYFRKIYKMNKDRILLDNRLSEII